MTTIKIEDDSKIILETLLRVRPDFTKWANQNFPHLMKDRPIVNWEEFKEQVAKFAHEKRPDLFYFRAKAEVVIGNLSPGISYVDNLGEDNWVQLADDRTYEQMLKTMESIYDENQSSGSC